MQAVRSGAACGRCFPTLDGADKAMLPQKLEGTVSDGKEARPDCRKCMGGEGDGMGREGGREGVEGGGEEKEGVMENSGRARTLMTTDRPADWLRKRKMCGEAGLERAPVWRWRGLCVFTLLAAVH